MELSMGLGTNAVGFNFVFDLSRRLYHGKVGGAQANKIVATAKDPHA
jgi:hypothetical protein